MDETTKSGRVAVIGCGPGGMAAAISAHQAGHEVALFERYPEARPAGNILNLWPPPIKALALLGVDIEDLGAPCHTEFRSSAGRTRARVELPAEIIEEYGGGFIGMLRPQLYRRLLDALPDGVLHVNRDVERIEQDGSAATLHFADGSTHEADVVVGADGIDSLTRRVIWGASDKREHDLHIFGGFTFEDVGAEDGLCIISHNRDTQGSWTAIRHDGRAGHQWWTLTATDGSAPFEGDFHAEATRLGADFGSPIPELIAATDPDAVQRWVIRDRPPLDRWSKGRVTLVGDAAHPTSPYAAYGAGMAIEDGYFLGRRLAGVDLGDAAAVDRALTAYEDPRKPHTAFQSQMAYRLGRIFHHLPGPLRPVRDLVFDRTPFLQKVIGEQTPKEILEQIDVIDGVEREFAAAMGR